MFAAGRPRPRLPDIASLTAFIVPYFNQYMPQSSQSTYRCSFLRLSVSPGARRHIGESSAPQLIHSYPMEPLADITVGSSLPSSFSSSDSDSDNSTEDASAEATSGIDSPRLLNFLLQMQGNKDQTNRCA
jgi:hypothetical protein